MERRARMRGWGFVLSASLVFALTASCGLVSMSVDDLSSGGADPGIGEQGDIDAEVSGSNDGARSSADGMSSTDGANVGDDEMTHGGDATFVGNDGGGTTIEAGEGGVTLPCPLGPCAGGGVCCFSPTTGKAACASSCTGGATPLQCAAPSQCPTASPICCATATLGAGSLPACPLTALTSVCAASCTTSLSPFCPAPETFRTCLHKSDCAGDSANPNCCQVVPTQLQGGMCISDLIKNNVHPSTCYP